MAETTGFLAILTSSSLAKTKLNCVITTPLTKTCLLDNNDLTLFLEVFILLNKNG